MKKGRKALLFAAGGIVLAMVVIFTIRTFGSRERNAGEQEYASGLESAFSHPDAENTADPLIEEEEETLLIASQEIGEEEQEKPQISLWPMSIGEKSLRRRLQPVRWSIRSTLSMKG